MSAHDAFDVNIVTGAASEADRSNPAAAVLSSLVERSVANSNDGRAN